MPRELPVFTSPFFFLGIFLASLLGFYVLFMVARPLGRLGWICTDYAWALAVLVGLVGTSIKIRQEVAGGYIHGHADAAAAAAYRRLRADVLSLGGPAVCRSIPGGGALQGEFDAACRFGREALGRLSESTPTGLDPGLIERRPPATDPGLLDAYRSLDRSLAEFREARARLDALEADREYTAFDRLVLLLSPALVAVGAALRVVKITAEAAMERDAARRRGAP